MYVCMILLYLCLYFFFHFIHINTQGHSKKASMSLSQKGGPTRTFFADTLISDSPRLLNYENTYLLSGAFCYSNQWLLR